MILGELRKPILFIRRSKVSWTTLGELDGTWVQVGVCSRWCGDVGGREGPSTAGAVGMLTRLAFGRRGEVESKKMKLLSSNRKRPFLFGATVGEVWSVERRRVAPALSKEIEPMVVEGSRLTG